MVESSKQVRVDNWGIFFLQRLQMFFNKTDYCDLTLQFEGNVQLKVHRLVMNACTEYFQLLEQTCDVVDDNVIMMPTDLQADVILPIVNFMYTGTLEFQMSIYDKLYKTAELMNIPVLIKLLEAQKTPVVTPRGRKTVNVGNSVSSKSVSSGNAKTSGKALPATLPGRKLPVWKRKNVPNQGYSVVSAIESKSKGDPLAGSAFDNAPKPTRFEWPEDDDLKPSFDFMVESTAFDSITYSSAPLIKQEDEMKSTPNTSSYDEIHYPNQPVTKATPSQSSHFIPPIADYDDEDADDPDYRPTGSTSKRKQSSNTASCSSAKKVRFNEKENKELKINAINAKGVQELDHSKIISEVLKKYPDLVKNNKNIKLKILTKPTGSSTITASADKSPQKGQLQMMKIGPKTTTNSLKSSSVIRKAPISVNVKSIKTGGQTTATTTTIVEQHSSGMMPPLVTKPLSKALLENANENTEGPWGCTKCSNPPDPYHLYYLYRKHMTDVHNEMFDALSCKYCGHRSTKNIRLLYHQYTVHGIAPSSGRVAVMFPRCDRCSYTGITEGALARHRERHARVDVQCEECKVGFNGNSALTAHMRITGHARKSGKSSYDCQYCTRRFQTGANLFTHLRRQHGDEARRDGIVSLDEMMEDDEEDEEDAGGVDEETGTTSGKDKVKILTDVKVLPGILRGSRDNNTAEEHVEQIELEPSSEAESLSNVATGIATSLGLVDIVVLDDNQQYILQSNPGHDGHQTEFILPELSSTTYVTNHHHLLSSSHTSVAGNSGSVGGGGGGGNNSNTGAATTTDELVMVLTDHDYQDAVEGEGDEHGARATGDSSGNIVVLYSHPVGGEGSEGAGRGRYITTQGNLMMTADGMIEIRNSDGIVAATADTSQHESIELIQQELNSGIVDNDKQQEMDTREIHLEEDEEDDEEQLIEEHLEEEHLDEEDLQEIHLECEENPLPAECEESKGNPGEIEENIEAVGEIEETSAENEETQAENEENQVENEENQVENEENQVENVESQVGNDENHPKGVNEESLVDNDEKLGNSEETAVKSIEIQQDTDENKEKTVDVQHEESQQETEGNQQEVEGNQLVNDEIQLDSHKTSENQVKDVKTPKIVDDTTIIGNEIQINLKNASNNVEVTENVKKQLENAEIKGNNKKCENSVEEIVEKSEKSENLVEQIVENDENKSDLKKGDSAFDNTLELVEKQGKTIEDKEDKSDAETDKDQPELTADVDQVDGIHLVEDEIAKEKAEEAGEVQQQDEAMEVDKDVDEVTTKINQSVNSSAEALLEASSESTSPKANEDLQEVPISLHDKPDIVILSQDSEENEETTISITDNKKTVYEPEPMEIDGKVTNKTELTGVESLDLNISKETDNMDDDEQEVIGEIPHVTGDDTDKEDNSEKDENLREKMVKAHKFEEQLEKSRGIVENKNDRVSKSVKNTISLLDDWEDTDSSQQSEKATISTNLITGRSNVSAVKKLINDWDDDE